MTMQKLSHFAVCVRNLVKSYITTKITSIKMLMWGAKTGKGCSFIGIPTVHLLPGSKLVIGNNCKFRSGKKDNYIGLATPCIFSTLSRDAKIVIGDNCGMSGAVIGAGKSIIIGNNVKVGANTVITDTDWHPEDSRSGKNAEVKIEDNVWLGYGVVVLKGVTIGENSVIGARSVVTRSIPPNVVAAGNPCHIIRELSKQANINTRDNN